MSAGELPCEHLEAEAIALCVGCECSLCARCRQVGVDGLSRCAGCAGEVLASPDVEAAPILPEPAAPEALAWEQGDRFTSAEALLRTLGTAVSTPFQYMTRVPWSRRDLRTPLVFAVICGTLGLTASMVSGVIASPDLLMAAFPPDVRMLLGGVPPIALVLLLLPLLPLWTLAQVLISAAVAHVMIGASGTRERPFEASLRVFAYAEVGRMLLMLPLIGPLASPLFSLGFQYAGLRIAHRLTPGRTVLALLPLLLPSMLFLLRG